MGDPQSDCQKSPVPVVLHVSYIFNVVAFVLFWPKAKSQE